MASVGRPKQVGDTQGRCIEAAEHLFAAKGFDATSLREVGSVAGITGAAVLHHFSNKEKLYGAVLGRLVDTLTDHVGEVEGDDDFAVILNFFERFMSFSFEYKHYAQLLLRELIENENRVLKARRLYLKEPIKAVVLRIKRGQSLGKFRNCDAELFVFYITGAITHFAAAAPTIERMLDDENGPARERFRQVMRDQIHVQLTGQSAP